MKAMRWLMVAVLIAASTCALMAKGSGAAKPAKPEKQPTEVRRRKVVKSLDEIAPEVIAERDKLLPRADARIRKRVVELAEKFPQLKKTEKYWKRLPAPSVPGCIGISLFHTDRGKVQTTREPMPEEERVSILIIVCEPPPRPGQIVMFPLYPNLGLVGQIGLGAGNPKLDAALKKLVAESLLPLKQLEERAAVPWGQAVEGVQVRLRADKRVWKAGEVPTFKADARNKGDGTWAVSRSHQFFDIEWDGKWYQYTWPFSIQSSYVRPGKGHNDISINMYPKRRGLKLAPGKHTVRVRMRSHPEAASIKPIQVVSNSVEIEILPAKPKNEVKEPKAAGS